MTQLLSKFVLSWFSYPLVIAIAVMAHLQLMAQGFALPIATYVPVLSGALIITWLEWVHPYRQQWRPERDEVKADATYMLLVQILLPRLLGFLIALTLLTESGSKDWSLSTLWVHDWPIGLQAIAMILLADFLRYWVHRAAHNYSFLWRLHAVHHSTDKLYWVNTGRFHPIDKALQFVFDALPFILLGVAPEVLALYFVFYALNGFFQHSNIDLRFGLLNYIFSTAELHRWHHAKSIEESSSNYGNNTIVWDLLFGSWFLPKEKQVETLGLYNDAYPMSFMAQLKAPFTVGLDKRPISMLGMRAVWRNIITISSVQVARVVYWWPFHRATHQPLTQQQRVLNRIIKANADTQFGRAHNFKTINSIADYTQQVPIQTYATLRPYVDKQIAGEKQVLTKDEPFYYARTSGTTGDPKYIPVTQDTLKQHQRSLAIFAYLQYRAQPQAFSGTLLAIPGPFEEGRFDSGICFGSISGLMYEAMPKRLKAKYIVPDSVYSLDDYTLKYRLILRLMLPHTNMSYIASANPTTFKKLLVELQADWQQLLDDVEKGGFYRNDDLPTEVQEDVMPLLNAHPERAATLRKLERASETVSFAQVWPNIRLVVTWTGGSCGIAVNHIKPSFPSDTVFMDLGYLSSEMRGTITIDKARPGGVPTLLDHFFEFIEVSEYEQGVRDTLTLDKLVVGKQYYFIMTTTAGLYRYFMNDIVEVVGMENATPMLTFIQKGKGVTNITGEKLAEQQVISAMETIKQTHGVDIPFYLALACVEQAHYVIYVEMGSELTASLSDDIEHALNQANIEYASKRESGRLNQLEVKYLKAGTADAYKTFCVEKGQRESQYKPLLLQYQSDNTFPFEQYVVSVTAS